MNKWTAESMRSDRSDPEKTFIECLLCALNRTLWLSDQGLFSPFVEKTGAEPNPVMELGKHGSIWPHGQFP